MFNHSRQVTETTISNIAIRRKKQPSCLDDENSLSDPWITPHLSCGLLNGVRRQFLLGQGEITEGFIKVDDLVS
jgi:branched-subunit amino acid aminotransferase/4-amino-4-deoxychorismate lyase